MMTPSHPKSIVPYQGWHKASEALFDAMFDDIGIEVLEVREATRKWCTEMIADEVMNMGDLQYAAICFADGYLKALVDRDLTSVVHCT
jgi:hypothetical protein